MVKRYFDHAIAVTGGFASGKSRVAKALAELTGYRYWDADCEVACLLEKNAPGWQGLRAALDSGFFRSTGDIDKAALRQAIFIDDTLRTKVEAVLHPLVRCRLKEKVEEAYRCGNQQSVVEVPLLYEANWQDDFPVVVVVSVCTEIAVKRAMKRDGLTEKQATEAVLVQYPLKKKRELADYVINNEHHWESTKKQLFELKKLLTAESLQPSIE